MGKHKHAEIIKAWADGAEVQVFRHEYDGYYWEDTATPNFNIDFDYRIKPTEKVVRWLWAWQDTIGIWSVMHCYMTENEFNIMLPRHSAHKRLEWSREEFDE